MRGSNLTNLTAWQLKTVSYVVRLVCSFAVTQLSVSSYLKTNKFNDSAQLLDKTIGEFATIESTNGHHVLKDGNLFGNNFSNLKMNW